MFSTSSVDKFVPFRELGPISLAYGLEILPVMCIQCDIGTEMGKNGELGIT